MQCVRENPDQAERSYCALALEDAGKFLFCCLQRKLFDSVYMWGQSPKLQWAQVGCQDPFWKTEHILFLEHGVKFCFIHNVIFKAIEIFMGLPPPQSEAGVAACIPLPLDYLLFICASQTQRTKSPLVSYIYFLKKKRKPSFHFLLTLGKWASCPGRNEMNDNCRVCLCWVMGLCSSFRGGSRAQPAAARGPLLLI